MSGGARPVCHPHRGTPPGQDRTRLARRAPRSSSLDFAGAASAKWPPRCSASSSKPEYEGKSDDDLMFEIGPDYQDECYVTVPIKQWHVRSTPNSGNTVALQ
jgi:hypothetical protein